MKEKPAYGRRCAAAQRGRWMVPPAAAACSSPGWNCPLRRFLEVNDDVEAALVERMDRLAVGCTQGQYRWLEEILIACSRYGTIFWGMAWELEK